MTTDGLKWKMGIPELIIIMSLIIALATTMNMKASSKDFATLAGRVSVIEWQYDAILAAQTRIEAKLDAIDQRRNESIDRLSRMEESRKQK